LEWLGVEGAFDPDGFVGAVVEAVGELDEGVGVSEEEVGGGE